MKKKKDANRNKLGCLHNKLFFFSKTNQVLVSTCTHHKGSEINFFKLGHNIISN